jgi:DNA-directed RNA polymerase specialized sigma24 family protein
MSARESRAPARQGRCTAASANDALALHQQSIEEDPIGWTYRTMESHGSEELRDIEPMSAILERLSPEQRLLVVAWFHRERTYREIAAWQGIAAEDALAHVRDLLRTLNDGLRCPGSVAPSSQIADPYDQ